MKTYLLSMILIIVSSISFGQSPLGKGEKQINLGLGLDDNKGIPIYGSLDFGIGNNFTIAPAIGATNKYVSLGGILSYHFDELLLLPEDWNIYAGANAGFFIGNDDNSTKEKDGFGLGAQIGGRYFFNERLGVNLELGGGNQVSGGKLGITILF